MYKKMSGPSYKIPFFKKANLCPFMPSVFVSLANKNLTLLEYKVLFWLMGQVPKEPLMRYKKDEMAQAFGCKTHDIYHAYQVLLKEKILVKKIYKNITHFRFHDRLLSKRITHYNIPELLFEEGI